MNITSPGMLGLIGAFVGAIAGSIVYGTYFVLGFNQIYYVCTFPFFGSLACGALQFFLVMLFIVGGAVLGALLLSLFGTRMVKIEK